jgi:hypothetical protein
VSPLQPKNVSPTDMNWTPPVDPAEAATLAEDCMTAYHIHDKTYMQSCSTCHR